VKLVKAEEARPGLKLARDVTDLRGNLLFKAGTEIGEALIQLCKERNVTHLFVEDDGTAVRLAASADARRLAAARDLDRLFSGTESNPVMAALREAAKRYLVSKIK
jgi:hypothetical protein